MRQSFLDGTFLTSSIPPKKPNKLAVARTVLHELIHILGAIHEQNRFEDLNFSIVCQNLFEWDFKQIEICLPVLKMVNLITFVWESLSASNIFFGFIRFYFDSKQFTQLLHK